MIVRTDALTVRFSKGRFKGSLTALDELTLEVREGDFFALLGQNGAGKSTAMHCFLGLLRPTAGRVEVLGERPAPGAQLFRHVGYLPEEPRYHEYLSVEEAVTYYARLSGIRIPQPRVAVLLDRLGLAEHKTLTIRRCSKGMKQKIGIAQCVAHEPRLLFLDEPMRGLDPMTVHLFRDMLTEMNRNGVTIVMNSHLLAEVELVATRAGIIDRGRLIAQDDVSKLVRREEDRYAVEIASSALPEAPYLEQMTQTSDRVCGLLAAADLYPFMEYARQHDLRILSCALQKQTLEESFVEIVRGGRPNA